MMKLDPAWSLLIGVTWLGWQMYAPEFGFETRLSPLMSLPDRTEHLEEVLSDCTDQLERIDEKQGRHIQVTRAQARAIEKHDIEMSAEEVDNYLVDNRVAFDEFIRRRTESKDDQSTHPNE